MRYRRKPSEIEAVKWTGENIKEVADFLNINEDTIEKNGGIAVRDEHGCYLETAYVGAYICKYPNGNPFVMTAYDFTCEYELIID